MNDRDRTKEDLIAELVKLRERIQELETVQDKVPSAGKPDPQWERYRLISENTSDLIAVTTFGMNPVYTYVSPSHERVMGYAPEELIGKSGFDFIHPEDKKKFLPLLTNYVGLKVRHLLTGREHELSEVIEYRIKDKAGHWRYLESTINIMKDELLFISRDVSVQKKTVESIKLAYAELMQIFNTTVEGVRVIDKEHNVLLVNETFSKLPGIDGEKMTGKKCYEVFNSHLCHSPQCPLTRILDGEVRAECDTEVDRKNGTGVPCVVTATPFRGSDGSPIGIVEYVRDITEWKKSERELRETKEFLERVIENSRDGILIVDENGYILSCNKALEKMNAYTKGEIVGKHASVLVTDDKAVRKRILEKTGELLKRGYTSYEATFKTKDGKYIDTECISSMIANEEGKYVAGVSIIRDVTERKRMEQQLVQSEKLKSLEALAGGVAHNFNNILAAILGRAQLLMMNTKTPPGIKERRKDVVDLRKSLEVIEEAARNGADTVRSIQDFSRKGTAGIRPDPVNLGDVINTSLELTRVRWQDEAQSRDIKIAIDRNYPPMPAMAGNVSELIELFTNLINNAIDAMPRGGEISITSCTAKGKVSITIQDTGTGIPVAIRDRIFDPFFTTKGVQSTGLGLSAAYGIVKRHKGTITVDSVQGQGTAFTMTFPVCEEVVEKKPVKQKRKRHERVRILVIEDEKDIQDLIADILQMNNVEVEVASTGSQGIKLFQEKTFDLVFTDLGMPGMSGWQVAKEIKKINNKMPVALITGWQIQLRDAEMKEKGVDLFINKPFKVDQLLHLVQEGMEVKDRYQNA